MTDKRDGMRFSSVVRGKPTYAFHPSPTPALQIHILLSFLFIHQNSVQSVILLPRLSPVVTPVLNAECTHVFMFM